MRLLSRLGILTLLLTSFLSLIAAGTALAQEQNQPGAQSLPTIIELFIWITPDGINWQLGGLFAAAGLIGALVTTFGLIGGGVPGTSGQQGLDADTERLERYSENLEGLMNNPNSNADRIREVALAVNNLQSHLMKERWRQFLIGAFLYALLGAAFATALAQDLLQAFVIGAGWTGVIGIVGLRKDNEKRRDIKNEVLTEYQTAMRDAAGSAAGVGDNALQARVEELERRAVLAKGL